MLKLSIALWAVSSLLPIASAFCYNSTGYQISKGPNHEGYGQKDSKTWVWWDKCNPDKPVECKPGEKLSGSCSQYYPYTNMKDQQMQTIDIVIGLGTPECDKIEGPDEKSSTGYLVSCNVPPAKDNQLARELLSKLLSPDLPVEGHCRVNKYQLQVETSCRPAAARAFCEKTYGGDANNQTWPMFYNLPSCPGFKDFD